VESDEGAQLMPDYTLKIYGANATMRALRQLDPEAAKGITKALRKTVEPIKKRGQELVPEIPLTNWYAYGWQNGRLDWWSAAVRRGIAVQVRTPRARANSATVLAAVINRNAAGAVFELAGKVNAGNTLDKGLQKKGHGPASRLIWRAFDELNSENQANREVEAVMQDVERIVQSALDRAGGSP
jgi:hypothetical protein